MVSRHARGAAVHSGVRWWPGHCWVSKNVVIGGVRHAVLIFDGGYFMDDEATIACTGEREPADFVAIDGVPTCVACWAVVLA